MHYSYHESTKLSQQNKLALQSIAATGELPNNHYWNSLRARHDANPTRFDRGNVVLAALLDRDQLQRQGILSATSPLFTQTGFFSYASAKHTLDVTRFDYYHPFLGRLLEISFPQQPTTAGEGLTPPITTPVTQPPSNLNPSPSDTNGGGGGGLLAGGGGGTVPSSGGTGTGGGGGGGITPSVTPEPASVILMGIGLLSALVWVLAKRRWHRQDSTTAAQPVMA